MMSKARATIGGVGSVLLRALCKRIRAPLIASELRGFPTHASPSRRRSHAKTRLSRCQRYGVRQIRGERRERVDVARPGWPGRIPSNGAPYVPRRRPAVRTACRARRARAPVVRFLPPLARPALRRMSSRFRCRCRPVTPERTSAAGSTTRSRAACRDKPRLPLASPRPSASARFCPSMRQR